MLAKSKIIGIVLAIIFSVSAITCGIVFGIIKSKPQSTATTQSATLTTNIFNTDGTLNKTAAQALLEAVGYYNYSATTTAYTAHNIAGRTSNNSGNSIIFKMGYASGTSGTDLVWQATYLYNNYLTIWLDKNYTTSKWNSSSVTVSYDSYASSTIQTYLNNTMFGTITQSNSTLQGIFATPREAGYQTIKSGTTNDTSYWYSSSYTSKFDNMSSGVADSYLWLPSHGEVFNNTTSSYSNSTTAYIGQWGLNSTDRAFDSSTSYSGSSTSAYCWLRSGSSSSDNGAMVVTDSGFSGGNSVNITRGVRPAAHISLDNLKAAIHTYFIDDYVLTLSVNDTDKTAKITKCKKETEGDIVIPSVVDGYTITSIADGGYERDVFPYYLTGITLPDTITEVGTSCFYARTALKYAILPKNLQKISNGMFRSCQGLETIEIPDSVTEIGSGAFYGCSSLTSIKLSNNLVSIYASTFEYCRSLTEITIPSSVINIESAFYDCTSLTSVYFEQTSNFTLANGAFTNGSSSAVYYFKSQSVLDYVTTNYGTTSYFSTTDFRLSHYEVKFESNGGSACDSIFYEIAISPTYGTLPTPTKTGYLFMGWYKSSGFDGSAVTANDEVVESHTLYAKFIVPEITISFDFQGGSGGTSSVVASFEKAMPTATAPTRTGYTFGGYYTGTNGSGTQYYTSTMTSAKNSDLVENTTLYAKWTINSYTITIQATEGGSVSSSGGSINYNQKVNSIAIASAGVAFLYWVRASDNAQITSNPLNETVTKNETYTAVFGASFEGVAVASTIGGLAYILGDNYDNLSDTDTITFSTKQALAGYTFSHWEDMNGNNLGTAMSIRLQKSLVMDNVITAVYVQSTNTNVNEDINN